LLATGDDVPNQAYRVGDRTWGVQWHFDVDHAELDHWLDTFERAEGPLERSWGKGSDRIREEGARHLVEHESKGREAFSRFARLAATAP
jgi:hypothetical protein